MKKPLTAADIERPEPSYQAILDRDGDAVPDVLRLLGKSIPPTGAVDFDRYTSQRVFELEMTKMWAKVWQFACREEHVPEVGDYTVYEIGRRSVIIVRTASGLKAYHNSCLHRGTKLKQSDSSGNSPVISCPYHGWTWNLEGDLATVPCAWDFPHLDRAVMKLDQVRVAVWNTLVFVSLAESGPSLEEYLEALPEHFKRWDFSGWVIGVHARKQLPCNWKAAQDAFIEGYHTSLIHPQCVGTAGDINAQHDIFGRHVSRDLVALGVSSPSLAVPLSDQEILDQMLVGDSSMLSAGRPRIATGETARSVMARNVRESMRAGFGLDLSGYSIAETIDSIKYTLFPNLFIFAGLSVRILYQYRPLGNDPDRCLFDIMFLRPAPKDGPHPAPAEIVEIGEEESYCGVPGMDPGWGLLFDQDTNVLRFQRDGMHTSKRGKGLFSAYLESRLRHIQQTMDGYLNT